MNVQCTSKLQRFHLSLIFTLTIAITAPSVFAATFDAAIDILPMRSSVQETSPQIMPPEHGSWVSLGTHDSTALPTPAPPVLIAKAILDRRQPAFTPKVVVDQVVEPYIAVGPFTPNSLTSIRAMDKWIIPLSTEKAPRNDAYLTPLDLRLQELAAEEPVDIENCGPSVLIPENRPLNVSRIEIAPINPLIGSSPVIATVEEDYMPYDLSARDLQDWNSFPIASHPFCVRTDIADKQTAGLWAEFDTAMALSKSSDPVELNGLTTSKVGTEDSATKSPSSPSDLAFTTKMPSTSDKYHASQHKADAAEEVLPSNDLPNSATNPDEALAILIRPESLSLSPAPEHTAAPAEKQRGDTKPDPADIALRAIFQNLSDTVAINSVDNMNDLSSATGRLIGSYTGSVSHWVSDHVANLASDWPTTNQSNHQSRIGAKLLSRASVLESGMIEEHTIGVYIPIERIDGMDCGGKATLQVADAKANTKAR